MTPILLDTSVIVALLDRSQKEHDKCVGALAKITAQLITAEAVIAEAATYCKVFTVQANE